MGFQNKRRNRSGSCVGKHKFWETDSSRYQMQYFYVSDTSVYACICIKN